MTVKMSFNVPESTREQLEELVASGASDMTGAMVGAIDRLHKQVIRSRAPYRPTYSEFYIFAEEGDDGAFQVTTETEDGVFTHYLRKATLEEALESGLFYVPVRHAQEYPHAVHDFEEVLPPKENRPAWARDMDIKPRRFCEAALVATPKAALV